MRVGRESQGTDGEAIHFSPPIRRQARQRLVQKFQPEEGAEGIAGGIAIASLVRTAFSRHDGIYGSDVFNAICKPGTDYRFPVGSGPGNKTRRKETRLPIVAMSSVRLFLDRVARQHCPSPLHRHMQFNMQFSQVNMHFSQAPAKGDISTLPAGGHFYFALTQTEIPVDAGGAVV